MNEVLKEAVWNQFGASLDMLENAIRACPDDHWDTETRFWYQAYHVLFFLDYYLTLNPKEFSPPAPFTESEFEDTLPDRVYSKAELLSYLAFSRQKFHTLMTEASDETFSARWVNQSETMNYSVLEILLYNLRHVQHHTGQLNLLLRQSVDTAPEWVERANTEL